MSCIYAGNYGGPWLWDDATCSELSLRYSRICSKTIGYTRAVNGKYYKKLDVFMVTHAEARQLCEAEGARLAIAPYGSADWKAFEKYTIELSLMRTKTPAPGYLVDGTDEGSEGTWRLPNGVVNRNNELC